MAYTADINIVVRGARELAQLQTKLKETAAEIRRVDDVWKGAVNGPKTLNSFNKALQEASTQLRLVKQGTDAETTAVENYVRALNLANAARERQNRLIADQIAKQRTVTATANAGFGLQGPALPPASSRTAANRTGGTFSGLRGRIPGAISGGVIGGAFPLLFGQGGGAAAGGAIGGLLGGLAGPGGSFAGALLGTLLGDIASQGQKIRQLATDIGFSAQQTEVLSNAFKKANTDAEKFTAVIQNIRGLGLELEDQARLIQLTTSLTEKYGGQFEKVGSAITSALESGKVSQATLNQLTSQGVNVQEALADRLGVSRDKLLEMAKKGEISLQQLIDVLVDVGNKGVEAADKPKSGMDRLGKSVKQLGSAFGDLAASIVEKLTPSLNWLAGKIATIVGLAAQGIQNIARMLGGGTKLENQAAAMAGAQLVRENPELRTMRGGGPKGTNLIVQNGTLAPGALGRLTQKQRARYEQLQGQALTKLQQPQIGKINVSGLGQAAPTGTAKKERKPSASLGDLLGSAADESVRTVTSTVLLENQRRINDALAAGDKRTAQLYEDQQRFIPLGIQLQAIEQQRTTLIERQAEFIAKGVEPIKIKNKIEELNAKYAQIQADSYLELARLAGETATRDVERTNAINQILFGLDIEEQKARAKNDAQRVIIEMLVLENQLKQQGIILTDKERQAILNKMDAVSKAQQKQKDMQAQIEAAINQAGGLALNAIEALISRTQSWQEVLRGLLADVGSLLFRLGISMLGGNDGTGFFSILSGNFGKRAGGGPVSGQRPYLVGERGPELFVPGTGGSVVPTGDLRAAMGATPGSSGAPVLNMSFETSTINGVEYVSRDQLEAAMAATRRQAARDGAQRGMTMTLDRLQQSPNTRRRVGF